MPAAGGRRTPERKSGDSWRWGSRDVGPQGGVQLGQKHCWVRGSEPRRPGATLAPEEGGQTRQPSPSPQPTPRRPVRTWGEHREGDVAKPLSQDEELTGGAPGGSMSTKQELN